MLVDHSYQARFFYHAPGKELIYHALNPLTGERDMCIMCCNKVNLPMSNTFLP